MTEQSHFAQFKQWKCWQSERTLPTAPEQECEQIPSRSPAAVRKTEGHWESVETAHRGCLRSLSLYQWLDLCTTLATTPDFHLMGINQRK